MSFGDESIPWALSDILPSRLVTASEMDEPTKVRAQREADTWTANGLATRDRCNRCAVYYDTPNPHCVNARIHGPRGTK
jgi:hypothetical protein